MAPPTLKPGYLVHSFAIMMSHLVHRRSQHGAISLTWEPWWQSFPPPKVAVSRSYNSCPTQAKEILSRWMGLQCRLLSRWHPFSMGVTGFKYFDSRFKSKNASNQHSHSVSSIFVLYLVIEQASSGRRLRLLSHALCL